MRASELAMRRPSMPPRRVRRPIESWPRFMSAVAEVASARPRWASPSIRHGVGGVPAGFTPGEIAQVDREQTAGADGPSDRDQGLIDGGSVREVVENVADGDDRVRLRQGILRENEPANVIGSSRIRARQLEHRPRGVGGEDAVPGVDELPRQQAAPASELEDETLAFPHGLEELEDPRRAGIGVEAEAPVVHEREIGAVVGVAGKDHSTMVAPSPR